MNYTCYTNMDSRFSRLYEQGDRLVQGWTGEVDFDPAREMNTLERIFITHNRDDRPDGQLCPSLSIGDVVVIGEDAWSVDDIGFAPVDVDPLDLITDKTWREVPYGA